MKTTHPLDFTKEPGKICKRCVWGLSCLSAFPKLFPPDGNTPFSMTTIVVLDRWPLLKEDTL